ncbi:peptide/nickel transport system ATP-binding protein [Amycolatopsis sacchari]|uniref:Peptide/nickel transport system ATP-binding protein n=1 Tax=Amycolatopsis sacchari TaxID=115433 RepID=A0A1I3RII5_9PSEU|nr:ABC transporter ATP-binding protein [Amycolatopsis sacchari]SFJ45539.1 peptide/nickel transport system ATP-binding protein [Amycolatopsis sacchari]
MTDLVLEAEDLRVQFGQTVAVDGVSLRVRRGHIVGLVGESGSGKSVTARTLMRMVPEPGRVTGGTVRFDGQDLLALPEREMRSVRGERIAMVFQDPQASLNPVMTIGAQVAEALIVHGTSRREAHRRAVELLELVGIPDAERRAGEHPHQFSGGMRQRVVIAMALAGDPALLVADEPTTALDVTIQAQILRLLAELRDRIGVAVLLITHDMGVVAELCDELAVMYGGRIVETGTVAEVFAEPAHPYTRDLLRAMPRLDDVRRRLYAIPGQAPDPAHLPMGCAFHPRCALAQDRCREEKPALTPFADGREVACWFPVDTSETPKEPATTAARVAPGEKPVLEIEDLRVNVGGRRDPVYAVDGVGLRVHAGETLGLVGESGCGKSTLARTVVGINEPVSGGIRVLGKDFTEMARREVAAARRKVQYVFQDPYASLNPRRTIRQVLDEALEVAGVAPAQRRARSVELLELVGLGERHLDRYPHAFSGGQRQRIGIARALAVEPECLVLDEPVSALDVSIQAQVMNLLTDLRDRLGLGYLFIAHDLAVVRSISDRVAVMYLGRIVETGPAEDVYRAPQHPYTVSLLSSSPSMERERERIVLTGDLPSPKNPPSGCRFRTRCPIGPLTHPERTICVEQSPVLPGGGHGAACHFAGELLITEGKAAV